MKLLPERYPRRLFLLDLKEILFFLVFQEETVIFLGGTV